MSSRNIRQSIRLLALLTVSLLVLIVFFPQRSIQSLPAASSPIPQSSYLFRFDPASQTFFTYTLPLASLPSDVVVTGSLPTHVWIAEYGRDRIGHLVYTDSNHIEWHEYPLAGGSQPFRMTLAGNNIWFTERGANRIGRLNVLTEQIDEFYAHGLSSGVGLANIKVASDGHIWATAQWSNRFIGLTITDTNDYAFHEYTNANLISPLGLALASSEEIWVASTGAHLIGVFSQYYQRFSWITYTSAMTAPIYPAEISYAFVDLPKPHREVWFSDWHNNRIGLLYLGTLPVAQEFGPVESPSDLANGPNHTFWVAQQNKYGAIGRIAFTDVLSTTFVSYPLPINGPRPEALALASDDGVWTVAYAPFRSYLPIVHKN